MFLNRTGFISQNVKLDIKKILRYMNLLCYIVSVMEMHCQVYMLNNWLTYRSPLRQYCVSCLHISEPYTGKSTSIQPHSVPIIISSRICLLYRKSLKPQIISILCFFSFLLFLFLSKTLAFLTYLTLFFRITNDSLTISGWCSVLSMTHTSTYSTNTQIYSDVFPLYQSVVAL